jgi:hypothetical protein
MWTISSSSSSSSSSSLPLLVAFLLGVVCTQLLHVHLQQTLQSTVPPLLSTPSLLFSAPEETIRLRRLDTPSEVVADPATAHNPHAHGHGHGHGHSSYGGVGATTHHSNSSSTSNSNNNNSKNSNNKLVRTRVVVFIPTKLTSADRRLPVNAQFAREQWSPSEVVVVWIVGTRTGPRLETALDVSAVFAEPHMTADNVMVFASACRDDGDEPNNANGTSSTTCKFYEGMRFLHEHFDADYAIRGADDAYLNVRRFLTVAPSLPRTALWLGQARDSTRNFDLSLSKSQPNLARLFGLTHFSTNYMLGMGFAFTWDVVRLMGGWNIPPHLTWCEDVMVGMYLNVFQINRVSRPDLFVNRGGSVANRWFLDGTYGALDVVLLHYIQPEDWANIHNNGTIFIPGPK